MTHRHVTSFTLYESSEWTGWISELIINVWVTSPRASLGAQNIRGQCCRSYLEKVIRLLITHLKSTASTEWTAILNILIISRHKLKIKTVFPARNHRSLSPFQNKIKHSVLTPQKRQTQARLLIVYHEPGQKWGKTCLCFMQKTLAVAHFHHK